jgi:hypothetical protein
MNGEYPSTTSRPSPSSARSSRCVDRPVGGIVPVCRGCVGSVAPPGHRDRGVHPALGQVGVPDEAEVVGQPIDGRGSDRRCPRRDRRRHEGDGNGVGFRSAAGVT